MLSFISSLVDLRVLLVTTLLSPLALAIAYLPPEARLEISRLFNLREQEIREKLIELIPSGSAGSQSSARSASAPATDAIDRMEISGVRIGTIVDALRGVVCPQVAPVFSWKSAIVALGGALGLASLICKFLPARPRMIEPPVTDVDVVTMDVHRELQSTHDELIAQYNRLVDTYRNLRDGKGVPRSEYAKLALRAAQFRGLMVYALLSSLATFSPNLQPSLDAKRVFESGNAGHLLSLIVAAVLAAAYATQRPSVRYREVPLRRFAIVIGFGGIFLGGTVALLIALPYNLLTPVEAQGLTQAKIVGILSARLLLLPLAGAAGAYLCAAVMRARHPGGAR